MLLLLQISRTRDGASALLDAGLVSATRDSLLFRADPDLGISIPNPDSIDDQPESLSVSTSITSALQTYYILLSAALRLLLSTFLSRGAQNEQIQHLTRAFLTDYRPNMVGVFKKYTGVSGKIDPAIRALVEECVRCYTGLSVLGGFIDVSSPRYPTPSYPRVCPILTRSSRVQFEDESGLDPMQVRGFS